MFIFLHLTFSRPNTSQKVSGPRDVLIFLMTVAHEMDL